MSLTDSQKLDCLLEQMKEFQIGLGRRLDGIDERLDGIDERLDGIDERLDGIDERLDNIEGRLDKVEGRLDKVEGRLDRVESSLEAVKAGQLKHSVEIKKISDKLEMTYQIALEAWGRSVENRKLLSTV